MLSACIIAFNEEDRIEDCIRSLDFCDEVLVVDSHSQDRTREIAAAAGARVVERDWPGHVEQKEFTIRQATYDWVLCVDADERIDPDLRREIIALRDNNFAGRNGWRMPRMSFYLGRWIRHGTWYPDLQLRLFNRQHGHWGGTNPHDRVQIQGDAGLLKGHLLHIPYRNLSEHLRTIDNYTTILARGMYQRGKRGGLLNLVANPVVRFFRYYVLKRGFLDGWHGLVMALLAAYYVSLKYIKLLIIQHVGDRTLSAEQYPGSRKVDGR